MRSQNFFGEPSVAQDTSIMLSSKNSLVTYFTRSAGPSVDTPTLVVVPVRSSVKFSLR